MVYTQKELERIAFSLSYQSLHFMPEFEVRVQVLKRLRYLGEENQLKLKGLCPYCLHVCTAHISHSVCTCAWRTSLNLFELFSGPAEVPC